MSANHIDCTYEVNNIDYYIDNYFIDKYYFHRQNSEIRNEFETNGVVRRIAK